MECQPCFKEAALWQKKLDTWLHALISVLSTVLLAASNLGLQLVTTPTRAEVDVAHRKGVWFDIEVASIRNLRNISKWSVRVWWFLTVSSIPVHFL
jgi:hypothetical protein